MILSLFEVEQFRSTNTVRHESLHKRPFRLHKQIKTPELISEQSQRNLRMEKREHNSLTKLATKLQLCMQLNIYNTL